MPMITWHEQADPEFYKRMDPEFWNPKYVEQLKSLRKLKYPVRSFKDLDFYIRQGDVPRSNRGEKRLERGEILFLDVDNVKFTGLDTIECSYITKKHHERLRNTALRESDVLFVRSGVGSVGKTTIVVDPIGKANVTSHIDVIRPKVVSPFYVGVYLKTRYGKLQCERYEAGVSGQTKITIEELLSFIVPILPDKVQISIKDEYLKMSAWHNKAMERKKVLIQRKGLANKEAEKDLEYRRLIGTAERTLKELIAQTERIIEGEQNEIEPIDDRKINREVQAQLTKES